MQSVTVKINSIVVLNSIGCCTMKRYILTGTPGSGKTVLIRYLENMGYDVVEEAATDVINLAQACGNPTPWTTSDFIEKIIQLQTQRRIRNTATPPYQFFDRSPLCTLALAKFLGHTPSKILLDEIDLIKNKKIYQNKVFFIENLGHCQQTDARKISFEDALRFEDIHEAVYSAHDYELIKIPNQAVSKRVQTILQVALV